MTTEQHHLHRPQHSSNDGDSAIDIAHTTDGKASATSSRHHRKTSSFEEYRQQHHRRMSSSQSQYVLLNSVNAASSFSFLSTSALLTISTLKENNEGESLLDCLEFGEDDDADKIDWNAEWEQIKLIKQKQNYGSNESSIKMAVTSDRTNGEGTEDGANLLTARESSFGASLSIRMASELSELIKEQPSSATSTRFATALQSIATFYTYSLLTFPIFTKSFTAGMIFALSDYSAQLIHHAPPFDVARILTAFLVGVLVFGPAAHVWYTTVFRYLPSTTLLSTLKKATLGQLIFGPSFTCVFFAAGMIQSQTFSFNDWWLKIARDLPGVWVSGLGFWPLVDFVSYKVISVQYIPLFVNVCSFVWTIYLSFVANRVHGGAE